MSDTAINILNKSETYLLETALDTENLGLLNRLGHYKEVQRVTKKAKETLGDCEQPLRPDILRCELLLASQAVENGQLRRARQLVATVRAWSVDRDAKELLCWSQLVSARTALAESKKAKAKRRRETIYEALKSCRQGLRITLDCGYGIYHIDLLTCRARAWLLLGDTQASEQDASVALAEGVLGNPLTGQPELLAAAHPYCGYAWGQGDARQVLGEALLLQAAHILGRSNITPASFRRLPPPVRDLIKQAREELRKCLRLRKRIRDPKWRETQTVIDQLRGGILTKYPLDKPKGLEKGEKPKVRDQVFISYSHKDEVWFGKLQIMLTPLMRNRTIDVWADTRIVRGAKWREEIKTALERAKVAVLLVSDYFLASDFIHKNELPPILEAAGRGQLTILWVYLSECMYEETPIKEYQAAHRPLTPLDSLATAKQKSVLKGICQAIKVAATA